MNQAERDRLVTLRKAKKVITQQQAAEELGVTIRQVQRLPAALKQRGDKAVIHGLRGMPSKRKIVDRTRRKAMQILSWAAGSLSGQFNIQSGVPVVFNATDTFFFSGHDFALPNDNRAWRSGSTPCSSFASP